VAGFVTTLLGAGGIVGGLVLTSAEAGSQSSSASNAEVPGLVLMGVGAAAYLAGLFVMLAARPHIYDAMNAYNDTIEARGAAGSAVPAPAPAPVPTVVQPTYSP
jgi:hypothetical protein